MVWPSNATMSVERFHEPCPACGGSVHRVAGRCRHCKADLVALRAQAAAAARAARRVEGCVEEHGRSLAWAQANREVPLGAAAGSSGTAAGIRRGGARPVGRRRRLALVAAALLVLAGGVGAGFLAGRALRSRPTERTSLRVSALPERGAPVLSPIGGFAGRRMLPAHPFAPL